MLKNVQDMFLTGRLAVIVFTIFLTADIFAQDGAELYKRNCAACHSLGGGRLVGPDLAGVTKKADRAWLSRFIRNSAEMIKSGDAAAVAIGKEYNNLLMPPFTGSDGELSAIIDYIDSKGGSARTATVDTFLNSATAENVARGRALFSGTIAFHNAGVSCITCHSVHDAGGMGGSLSKSLNLSYVMLTGQGIKALLQAPPFPAMTDSYKSHALTDPEVYDLAAYLKSISGQMVRGEATPAWSPFLVLGVSGWIVGIIMLVGLWRLRKRQSVNHAIFERQLAAER
jgi:mono/diheme cytochrome c family protein